MRINRFILTILLIWLPLMAKATAWTPETLPMVHLQDARRYVCNPDGVLTQAAVDSADRLLSALERDKGIETVVVVVNHLSGDDPYEFGMQLGRKYGIGSKTQRTGLIVILAVGDRSYQILTGNGLEGTLPDAVCRRIQNRVMVPALKRRNWDAAIVKTLESIDAYVREDPSLHADKGEEAFDDTWGAAALAFFAILCLIFYLSLRNSLRICPACGKRKLQCKSQRRVKVNGSYKIKRSWHCKACGYDENTYDDNPQGKGGAFTGMWFPPISPGGGRGFGGGGFSGGSFGGGSFGGGGSGGRF